MVSDNPYSTQLETKDDIPLEDLFDIALEKIDLYNEAERPFRELFVQEVSEMIFSADHVPADMTWERIGEGEHPVTGDLPEEKKVAMNVDKYSRALNFSQEFIEDNPSEMVTRRIDAMLEGAVDKEQLVIFDTFKQGIADGSGVWYDIPDYGEYTFQNTHNHTFLSTQELFERNGGSDTNAHLPTEHLREANKEFRHHGRSPMSAMCSSEFAAELVNELSYDASYEIPDASDLRQTALPDNQIQIDGITLYQTPWINDEGSSEYTFYMMDDSDPVYFHEAAPIRLNGMNGAPVRSPGDILGATGSTRWGVKMVDPLAGVKVTADNLQ
jgi:hypothetical protein